MNDRQPVYLHRMSQGTLLRLQGPRAELGTEHRHGFMPS